MWSFGRDAEPNPMPALKEAGIQAHHTMAMPLWQGLMAAAKGWVINTEQTVAGLQGLPQPAEGMDDWQRAWDEMTEVHVEGTLTLMQHLSGPTLGL